MAKRASKKNTSKKKNVSSNISPLESDLIGLEQTPPIKNPATVIQNLNVADKYYRSTFTEKDLDLIVYVENQYLNDEEALVQYLIGEYSDNYMHLSLSFDISSIQNIIDALDHGSKKLTRKECFYFIKALFSLEVDQLNYKGGNFEKLCFLADLLYEFVKNDINSLSLIEKITITRILFDVFEQDPVRSTQYKLVKLQLIKQNNSNFLPSTQILLEDYYKSELKHLLFSVNEIVTNLPIDIINQLVMLIAENFEDITSVIPYKLELPEHMKESLLLNNLLNLSSKFLDSINEDNAHILLELTSGVATSRCTLGHLRSLDPLILKLNRVMTEYYIRIKEELDKNLKGIGSQFTKLRKPVSETNFWLAILAKLTVSNLSQHIDKLQLIQKNLILLENMLPVVEQLNGFLFGLSLDNQVYNAAIVLNDPSIIQVSEKYKSVKKITIPLSHLTLTKNLQHIKTQIASCFESQQLLLTESITPSSEALYSEDELMHHAKKGGLNKHRRVKQVKNPSAPNRKNVEPVEVLAKPSVEPIDNHLKIEPWQLAITIKSQKSQFSQTQELLRKAFFDKNSEKAVNTLKESDYINQQLIQQLSESSNDYGQAYGYINEIEIIISLLSRYKNLRTALYKKLTSTVGVDYNDIKKINNYSILEQKLLSRLDKAFFSINALFKNLFPLENTHYVVMYEDIQQQKEHLQEYFEQQIIDQKNIALDDLPERIDQLSHIITLNRQSRKDAELKPGFFDNKTPTYKGHLKFINLVLQRASLTARLKINESNHWRRKEQASYVEKPCISKNPINTTLLSMPEYTVTISELAKVEEFFVEEPKDVLNTYYPQKPKSDPIQTLLLSPDEQMIYDYLVPVIYDIVEKAEYFHIIQNKNRINIEIYKTGSQACKIASTKNNEIILNKSYSVCHLFNVVNDEVFKIEVDSPRLQTMLRKYHAYVFSLLHPTDTLKSSLKLPIDTDLDSSKEQEPVSLRC